MSSFWMAAIGLCCSVVLGLTGCGPPNPRAGTTFAEVYLSVSKAVNKAALPSPRIANPVGGDIIIITGRNDEIVADMTATGAGNSLELALEEADSHFELADTGDTIAVVAASGWNSLDRAKLHARVPAGTNLVGITTHAGNIDVCGSLGNVTAAITESGSIRILGASGEINLTTAHGSILADLAPGANNISAQARDGNIDIDAESSTLTAATTNGNIRFTGTMRNDRSNTMTITGTGNIDLVLPAYLPDQPSTQPYRIVATTSANPIITDYPPTVTVAGKSVALTICGFIHSNGPYDYHVENTPRRHFGRIEISPVTSTFFFSGTLGADFYRFDTDRTGVSLYAPVPQSIHIYTADQLNQFMAGKATIDPGCQGALASPAADAIVLNLKTDRGSIYIHHQRFRKN